MVANTIPVRVDPPVPYSWRLSVGLTHKDNLTKQCRKSSPRPRRLGGLVVNLNQILERVGNTLLVRARFDEGQPKELYHDFPVAA